MTNRTCFVVSGEKYLFTFLPPLYTSPNCSISLHLCVGAIRRSPGSGCSGQRHPYFDIDHMKRELPPKLRCDRCGGAHTTETHEEGHQEERSLPNALTACKFAALARLETSIAVDGRSVEEVIGLLEKAGEAHDYTAQRGLLETLRQRLDIADIKGEGRSAAIIAILRKAYTRDQYSELLQESFVNELPKDDVDTIVDALADERFTNNIRIQFSLENSVREGVYRKLKEKSDVKMMVSIVSFTSDLVVKMRLFEDLSDWISHDGSSAAEQETGQYGSFTRLKKDVSNQLFRADRLNFFRLLERGLLALDGLDDLVSKESDEALRDMLQHVTTIDDASLIMKFVRKRETLLSLVQEVRHALLSPEEASLAADIASRLAAAFTEPAKVYRLGRLRSRDPGADKYEVPNKFIMGLGEGNRQITIAWSNTKDIFEHKDIARRVGGLPKALCGGGAIELEPLDDGRTRVVFEGRSGTFGLYNETLLQHFTDALSEHLRQDLGTDVEVVIKPSGIMRTPSV